MAHEATFSKLESQVRSYCRETPNLFATARGAEIWDVNGTRFVDFLSGCGSLNYGHNHPDLKEAIVDYVLRDGVANALDFHTEAKLRFMTRFHEVVLKPRKLPHVMHFTGPTGANGVEAAIKLARKCTGRYAVAAFTNAFHGMSMGALSVTGQGLHAVRSKPVYKASFVCRMTATTAPAWPIWNAFTRWREIRRAASMSLPVLSWRPFRAKAA